jgi:uncharacterized protein involved in exopolysaccharide biosynthesis
MTENLNQNYAYDDEIDLFELWETIWSGKWLIIAVTAVFGVGGVGYALRAPEKFKAQVSVMPADAKTTGGGLSSALGNLGGLAALAGVSIGGGGSQEPIAVLKSRDFTSKFIEENALMPVLFPKGSDSSGRPVDIRDGIEFMAKNVLAVTEDKNTGLISVGVTWEDPEIAAKWANDILARLNEQMRARALEESERNVAFLQREISSTNVVSLQQAMGRVLETEMQKLMLARGNEQFAFKVIDKATPPKYRESPKRTLIVLVSILAGGFLGLLIVFIRKAIAGRRSLNASI